MDGLQRLALARFSALVCMGLGRFKQALGFFLHEEMALVVGLCLHVVLLLCFSTERYAQQPHFTTQRTSGPAGQMVVDELGLQWFLPIILFIRTWIHEGQECSETRNEQGSPIEL